MVSEQTNKRKAVGSSAWGAHFLFLAILAVLIATLTVVIWLLFIPLTEKNPEQNTETEANESASEFSENTETEVQKIDFQPTIDEWVKNVGGNKSILVYDLERDEIVGSYNAAESYNTASLYKLFVVYEGYRRLESGEWQTEDVAGSTGYTILECLDLAIRESYSPCAETLWEYIGHAELDEIIKNEFKITNSDLSHLISNTEDITDMMKIFYNHTDIIDGQLIAQIKDSMLVQPSTTYNWRQGLPSGFSKANVYNKVGWDYNPDGGYWNIYHDTAIVEFPEEDRHFIVTVMTNKIPYQKIRQLGTEIEKKFFSTY